MSKININYILALCVAVLVALCVLCVVKPMPTPSDIEQESAPTDTIHASNQPQ